MVRYSIDDVDEDMILGESIFLPTGKLLLAAGQKLQDQYRQRLKELGFSNILVSVDGTEEVVPQSTVSEGALRAMNVAVEGSAEELALAFREFRDRSVDKVKEFVESNRQRIASYVISSGMMKALEQFIDEIAGLPAVVVNLSALQQSKPSLVNHALNVALTALCIGRKYKFSNDEMKQLGIGALNYDIGLVALPRELLDKSSEEFTDEERALYRQHPLYGYCILSQHPTIPATASACALQHHEREDGTGYPRGTKGDNRPPLKDFLRKGVIHRFAEIVAIADTYDMLLCGRRYEGIQKLSPPEAVKALITGSGAQLNAEIVKTLLSIIPLYPVGARVRVTNAPTAQLIGYFGVVARDNPDKLETPQVIIYETKNRQKIKPMAVDLARQPGYGIELAL
jgi:HD-GYP domain-containing protein (c-di-GMP phosphodiesterase class II)